MSQKTFRAAAAVAFAPRAFVAGALCALALTAFGCNRGGASQNAARPPKSDFERSLDTVRRGQYFKIYVIRRKDGEPLQPDDKAYLRANTPMETGMWIVTEDNRTAIAGAGFEFEPKHLDALSRRFTIEDYTNK